MGQDLADIAFVNNGQLSSSNFLIDVAPNIFQDLTRVGA